MGAIVKAATQQVRSMKSVFGCTYPNGERLFHDFDVWVDDCMVSLLEKYTLPGFSELEVPKMDAKDAKWTPNGFERWTPKTPNGFPGWTPNKQAVRQAMVDAIP